MFNLALSHISATPTARVEVGSILTPSAPVKPNFVGLSIEVGGVLDMIGERGNSSALAALLRHLYRATSPPHAGPTLRLGGNSADDSCWHTAAPAHAQACGYIIGDADLAAYIAFAEDTAKEANVSYIIDTNFGLSPDPHAVAVPHVVAVLAARDAAGHLLQDRVSAFEVGNEMDLYATHFRQPGKPQHRNASYTEAEYEVEFAAYVAAYVAVGLSPKRMIQGATYAETSHGEWGKRFETYVESFAASMGSVSLHQYATSTCKAGSNVSAAQLLDDATITGKAGYLRKYAAAAAAVGVPLVVGEGNTASCGGQPGVSDTMASALWALAYLPLLSQAGTMGMNFHGGPHGAYPPIAFEAGVLQVRPLYCTPT
jgi:hypothetical protein